MLILSSSGCRACCAPLRGSPHLHRRLPLFKEIRSHAFAHDKYQLVRTKREEVKHIGAAPRSSVFDAAEYEAAGCCHCQRLRPAPHLQTQVCHLPDHAILQSQQDTRFTGRVRTASYVRHVQQRLTHAERGQACELTATKLNLWCAETRLRPQSSRQGSTLQWQHTGSGCCKACLAHQDIELQTCIFEKRCQQRPA